VGHRSQFLVVPGLLTTMTFDLDQMLGGCRRKVVSLIFVITAGLCVCLSALMALVGWLTGQWKAVGIAGGVIIAALLLVALLIYRRFVTMIPATMSGRSAKARTAPGPTDLESRRKRLGEIVSRAGLPSSKRILTFQEE
jgi:cobalamin biosynthesis protein CobD/CbiB